MADKSRLDKTLIRLWNIAEKEDDWSLECRDRRSPESSIYRAESATAALALVKKLDQELSEAEGWTIVSRLTWFTTTKLGRQIVKVVTGEK